jgi:ligand-binding sensor domain-containing protein
MEVIILPKGCVQGMIRVWTLVALFAFPCARAFAQYGDVKFDRLSVEQGLSNFTVSGIAQDKQGFLWLGTEDGLNRYDGYNFTVYRHDDRDSTSLPASLISCVYIDRSGALWVGVPGHGVARFDALKNSFHSYAGPRDERGIPVWRDVHRVFEDDNNNFWVCSNAGLWRYSPAVDSFLCFDDNTAERAILSRNGIRCVVADRNGTWWIGTNNDGIIRYDPRTHVSISLNAERDPRFLPISKEIIALCIDSRGDLWIGTMNGTFRYRPATNTLDDFKKRLPDPISMANGIVFDIMEDRRQNIWIGTFHGGLYRYIPAADTFLNYRNKPDDVRSIVNNRIQAIFEDRSGEIWFASYRAGLSRYIPGTEAFIRIPAATSDSPGLKGESFYAVAEDPEGRLWFASNEKGLSYFDRASGTYVYDVGDNAPEYESFVLYFDREGTLWTGQGRELRKLPRGSRRFVSVPLGKERLAKYEIKSIRRDRAGNLWVGTNGDGLYRFATGDGGVTHLLHSPDDPHSLTGNAIWCLFEDRQGAMWLGTFDGGMGRYDSQTDRYTNYRGKPDDSRGLSADNVYSITQDSAGYMWIGTFAHGLNRFSPTTGEFRRFTVADGLPNNFVKAALPDAKGNLWISTDRGIAKYNPYKQRFTSFTVADGLHGNVFLSGGYCTTRSGMIVFTGQGGATIFQPDSIKKIVTPPPVVITSFKVFDTQVALNDGSAIELKHDQNFLSFEFAALDFAAPERNQYAYKLEGVDTGWVESGTRRFARYTHLPDGEFTFRVKGSNKDRVWNEEGASLAIVIHPPWWTTLLFQLGILGVLVAIGSWFYNFRVNRLLEIERLRVKIASDLHDDIGSSLTRISLQSELIQEGIEPREMSTYLRNIATTSRELVGTMSDIVWSIDTRNDAMENLLNKIRDFGTSALGAQQIEFTFAHSGFDLRKKVPVDVRENIYLLCKEAINNIAKHSCATCASVIIRNDHDKLSVVIADNGKGWGGEEKLNSHGIKNLKMRAERLGGKLEFVNDSGARIVLTMDSLK